MLLRNLNGRADPMDAVFAAFFNNTNTPATWRWGAFSPSTDVRVTEEGYTLELDVPGLSDKDIDVTLEGRTLTLKGSRKPTAEEGYSRRERAFGAFERSFTLPEDADFSRVEAVCKNGVLTVTVPKAEAAKPKTITVKAQ